MTRRMMMEKAAKSLEMEIVMAFLETFGLTLEDCDLKELMCECREDFREYREWYLTCYA